MVVVAGRIRWFGNAESGLLTLANRYVFLRISICWIYVSYSMPEQVGSLFGLRSINKRTEESLHHECHFQLPASRVARSGRVYHGRIGFCSAKVCEAT